MAQVKHLYGIELLISIVHKQYMVYHPCISKGIRILHRYGLSSLQRQDQVLGVEHTDDWEDTVAFHLRHVTSCISHSLHRLLHLRLQISINEFLIAAQLCSMIATNALVVVAGLVLVEGVGCEIEHAVVERFVLQYLFVSGRQLLRCFAFTLWHEHRVVEITLVNLPHVCQAEQQHASHQGCRLEFLSPIEQ